jgi:dihydrofolate reductase
VKTVYYTATSIDGFIAAPNNSLDWLFQFGEQGLETYHKFIAGVGAIVMGSNTYEWLYNFEIVKSGNRWPYEVPAWIFTTRHLPVVQDADIRFVRGDVAPVHEAMKAAASDRNIWVVGGGELAGQFYDRGLLDELVFTLAPVTLGAGSPLFPRTTEPPLKFLAAKPFGGGFVELRYDLVYR